MRLLIINYEFPPLGGGAGNVSAYLARHTAAQGVEVAVLTSHYKGLPRRETLDGYEIYRVPVLRRHVYKCSIGEMFSFVVNSILPSWQLARKFKPDLVHIHSGFPTGPLGYWLKLTQGIPYIITLHGGEVPGFLPDEIGTLQQILSPATRLVWGTASSVVAVSDGLRQLSLQSIPLVNIEVVPNGVDCRYFTPPPAPRPEDGLVKLLFVGRVVRQKGLSYLLEALSMLQAQGRANWQLKIVGDGPLREELERQARELGLYDRVAFPGWLPFDQIPAEMRAADLFVLPSVVEGMPLVLLQAMACGLPVIATDVPGSVDLVEPGQNGFLIPAKEPAALAEALVPLLTDPARRRQMGARSRAIALSMDWSEIAKSYQVLYDAVLSEAENRVSVWT